MRNLLLVDFNSLFIRVATGLYASNKSMYSYNFVRNAVTHDIGIAIDSVNPTDVVLTLEGDRQKYWKLDVYEYYKENRSVKKDSGIDFSEHIYPHLEALVNEYRKETPFIVLRNPKCESDDILASLVFENHKKYDNIYIITMDSDFDQLVTKYNNVFAGFPNGYENKFILNKIKNENMLHKVIKGSAKDFVPNAYMPDNFLHDKLHDPTITGNQTAVRAKALAELGDKPKMEEVIEKFPFFKRNYELMAMINIPKYIQDENNSLFKVGLEEKNNVGFNDYRNSILK